MAFLTIERGGGNRGQTREAAVTKAAQEEGAIRRRLTARARRRPRWCSLSVPSVGPLQPLSAGAGGSGCVDARRRRRHPGRVRRSSRWRPLRVFANEVASPAAGRFARGLERRGRFESRWGYSDTAPLRELAWLRGSSESPVPLLRSGCVHRCYHRKSNSERAATLSTMAATVVAAIVVPLTN
jgi:hypothetical protein